MRNLSIFGFLLFCGVFAVAQTTSQLPPSKSPWVNAQPGAATGKVEEFGVPTKFLQSGSRKVWVYTPADYDAKRQPGYDLIIAFDGDDYRETIPLPTILDNLAASGKVAPMVALLIDNHSGAERIAELGNRAQFARSMAEELIPWVRAQYNVTRNPGRTIVTGSSAGGLGSLFVALKNPDLFGNVLAQSAALWRGNNGSNEPPYEWLTDQYKASPKLPVTIYMEVGALETRGALGGAAPSILEANRHLRDVLTSKGYDLDYHEVPGAQHEPGHWRDQIAQGILWLTGRWK